MGWALFMELSPKPVKSLKHESYNYLSPGTSLLGLKLVGLFLSITLLFLLLRKQGLSIFPMLSWYSNMGNIQMKIMSAPHLSHKVISGSDTFYMDSRPGAPLWFACSLFSYIPSEMRWKFTDMSLFHRTMTFLRAFDTYLLNMLVTRYHNAYIHGANIRVNKIYLKEQIK